MKWDEMRPRERDLLVAERIFNHHADRATVRAFTLNMSAAWEVVQKLKPTHSFELRSGTIAESARFTELHGGYNRSEFAAQCKHAPEAICLAALKAIGVDIG